MAEKTIGIRIQLNGLNTVITDIQTLENEIRKAKEDLKQVEIGGPIFNQLAKEISQAETKLIGLQDAARGISKEKTLEGFGKLGAGISSSFAAATAAVSLFGKESESVQKAAIQAQNLLTIALSLRGVAEVKTGAQIVAKTIAEKASTAATNATNLATKSLYTTLAANPYGAILAVVGLLITAFIAFGKEEEKAAEKTKTLNELRLESEKSIISETNKLRTLQKILNDGNVSLDAKQGAYTELQKLVPTLTNLTLEQAQAQGVLNSSIGDEIKLIELRAKQKAYETFFVQEETKNIEKNRKARESFIKTLNVELNQERLRLLQQNVARDEVERIIEGITQQRLAQEGFTDERENYRQVTEEILKLENKQTTVVNGQKTATDKLTKSQEERNKQREAYIQLLIQEIKLNSELLVQTTQLRDLDNKIIDSTQKKVDTAQSYADTLNNLKTFTQLYKEANDGLLPVQDNLGNIFDKTKKLGENFIDSLDTISYTTDGAKKAIEEFDKAILELGKDLSEDDKVLLEDFANNYKEIFTTVQLLQKFKGSPIGFGVEDFQKVVTDLNLSLGKITIDPYKRSAEEITAAKVTAKERYEVLKKSFVDEYSLYLQSKIDRKKLTDEEYQEVLKNIPSIASATFESLSGVGNELLKFEQGVTLTSQKIVELNKKLLELAPAAKAGFIVQNADEISKQYGVTIPLVLRNEKELSNLQSEISKKTFDEKKKYAEAINILQADLLAQGIDIETLSYEQRLILLEKFLNKAVDLTKEKNNGLSKEQENFLKITSRVVDEFASTINRISSLVAQSYSFQLETLEKKNKDALSKVTGDTEEANQKRIELESQYQLQRAQIEKEARIKALQFQKVQAITDTASAALATFSELGYTPAGFVLVGIGATLAAIQVGLIQQQINAAQSLAGGGMIRMGAGGMVMGPSHEQGGVSFANGGVNLEGGESVINRQSSMNYGGLLSSINQMGGGAPLVNNPSNSLSEERLIQAIAKTRQEPIRAYVMNSEITNGQAINRRLDELSTI
jgi:hypothetical protein